MKIFIDIDNTILATNYLLTTKYINILPDTIDINEPVGFIDFKNKKLNDWYVNEFLNKIVWNYVYENVVNDIKFYKSHSLIILTSRFNVDYKKVCDIFERTDIQLLVNKDIDYKLELLHSITDEYLVYEDHPKILKSDVNKIAVLQPWNDDIIKTNNLEFVIPNLKHRLV